MLETDISLSTRAPVSKKILRQTQLNLGRVRNGDVFFFFFQYQTSNPIIITTVDEAWCSEQQRIHLFKQRFKLQQSNVYWHALMTTKHPSIPLGVLVRL